MKNLLKILMLNVILANTALCSVAATTYQQIITTTVPPAVNMTAINTAAAQGTIDPQTGVCSSPSASFQLQTNGDDTKYTYVVQAKVQTVGGIQANAYAQVASQAYIMLGNNSPSLYPLATALANITGGAPIVSSNANVIAYPVSNALNNLASATFTNNALYGGLCYIVTTGASKNGTLVQTLGASPLANTYSIADDRAGVYQATVTFTANRNP